MYMVTLFLKYHKHCHWNWKDCVHRSKEPFLARRRQKLSDESRWKTCVKQLRKRHYLRPPVPLSCIRAGSVLCGRRWPLVIIYWFWMQDSDCVPGSADPIKSVSMFTDWCGINNESRCVREKYLLKMTCLCTYGMMIYPRAGDSYLLRCGPLAGIEILESSHIIFLMMMMGP